MSASGIGCTPITPHTAVKDFSSDVAISACAPRAPVSRANSSFAQFGRPAQIASAAGSARSASAGKT